MLDKIIRFFYYSLFLVTPILMLASTSELFEFNKMLFIYFIALAVLSLWLYKTFKEGRFFIRRSILDLPIFIFLGSQILSTIFSIDRWTSLFGYYGRFNGGLVSTIAYIILFYGFITLFDKSHREKLLKWSLISSILVILWGLPGRFSYDLSCLVYTGQLSNACWTDQFRPAERMFSTLGQPNWLGAYLAINFFIGLYFFINSNISKRLSRIKIKIKTFYFGYLVLNFCGILFSRSRSALIATGLGIILFFIFAYLSREGKKVLQINLKWIAILIIFLLLSVLIFKTGVDRIDKYLNFSQIARPTSEVKIESDKPQLSSEITESLDIRKIVWKGAFELGKKYPLFGTGVETFAYSYYFVRPLEHNLTSEWDYIYNKAHNEYFNYLATTGFTGLATYLFLVGAVVFSLWRQIFKKNKNMENPLLPIALLSSYISILITNFFGFSTTTINLFFFILIPGIISTKDVVFEKIFSKKVAFYGFLGGSAVLLYFLFNLVLYFMADVSYALGTNYAKVGDYQQAASYINKALQMRREHVYEDKYSYYLANLAFIAAYQKQKDLTSELGKLATFYNNQSLKASPQNVNYWKTLGKNDYLFYQISLEKKYLEDGVKALDQAQKLAPTDPKLPYSLAIYYSLLNDEYSSENTQEAIKKAILYKALSLNNIDHSIDLKPDYRDAYLLKAQLLKKYGEVDRAKHTLEFILDHINEKDIEVQKELDNL